MCIAQIEYWKPEFWVKIMQVRSPISIMALTPTNLKFPFVCHQHQFPVLDLCYVNEHATRVISEAS